MASPGGDSSTQVARQGCSTALSCGSLGGDATTEATHALQACSARPQLEDDSASIDVDAWESESSRHHGILQGSSTSPCPQVLGATDSGNTTASRVKSKRELDQDAMEKVLSMCRSPSVLQDDVLRGAPLSLIMRRFGSLWRRPPLGMTPAAAEERWAKSRQCDGLDNFFSHAWQTPGWQKYISLLLMFYSTPAMCSFVLAFIVLFALDLASFLPTVEVDFMEGGGNITVLEFCPWATIPVWLSLLALFAGPSSRCVRDRTTFLDAVCIHQHDRDLKRAGIYSISGILAKSHELTILWSPPYLSRLWCMYELATYAAINQKGEITFCLLFKYLMQLAGFICVSACSANTTLFVVFNLSSLSYMVGFMASIVPFTTMVRQWLPLIRAQKQFMEQLQAFRIENAECENQVDREFIVQSVQQLHGSEAAFNVYIRGPLKDRLRQSLPVDGLAYLEVLVMSAPMACHYCEWIAAYARAGKPWAELGIFTVKAVATCICWIPWPVKLLHLLISRSAAQRATPCADIAIAIRTSLAMYVIFALIIWAQWAGPRLVSMFGFWWLIGGGAMTGLVFYSGSLQASEQNSGSPASGSVG